MSPELFKALKEAYLEELSEGWSTWSSDHDGKLHLRIDTREDIKYMHIKPSLPGYTEYSNAFDEQGRVSPEDEEDIIIPFEELAENELKSVEDEFIAIIIAKLNSGQDA